MPGDWVASARGELEASDLRAVAPMGAPSGTFLPGCLAAYEGSEDVQDEIERVATVSPETLLDDIDYAFGSDPPPGWVDVARQPRRWLLGYARALKRMWTGVRGQWSASTVLFERETERVHTAAEQGGLTALFDGLHHRAYVEGGVWWMADPDEVVLKVPDEGLTLSPILGGPGTSRAIYREDGPILGITYPVPGSATVLTGGQLPPAAALDALLGGQRATILRTLERPKHAGVIAKAITATPGAATHHLKMLERADLIIRERVGRNVYVYRTARGDALLGLYEDQ
jgi:DNA-binding transcriptional ArsR family regulator